MNCSRELVYKEEAYEIQGAIFEVYREMGCGFLEAVYQECLEKELTLRRIPFVAQCELQLKYKGEKLKQRYIPDFICFKKIIIELKACNDIFRMVNGYVRKRLTRHLQRRSQRPMRPPRGTSYYKHLKDLGLVYL